MLNQCILVGKLISITAIQNETHIALRIEPHGKDASSTDYEIIPCIIDEALAAHNQAPKLGTVIGIKGKLKVEGNGTMNVHVEKMSFISSKLRETKQ